MSLQENVAAVHRLYNELNKGNLDVLDKVIDASFVAHGETMGLDQTSPDHREAMRQGIIWAKGAFPDLVVTIEDTIAEGDKVVSRLTWRGTQKEAVRGVPPSGKEITWTGIAINRFANGKIVERWFVSDELGLLRQMGMIPPIGADAKPPLGSPR